MEKVDEFYKIHLWSLAKFDDEKPLNLWTLTILYSFVEDTHQCDKLIATKVFCGQPYWDSSKDLLP